MDPVKDVRTRATKQTAQRQSQYPVMKSLRTGAWEPAEGGSAEEGPTEIAHDLSRDDTIEVEQNMPDAPPTKAPKTPKTSLKKLLAGHADSMSVIDRMLQQPLTISWSRDPQLIRRPPKIHVWDVQRPKGQCREGS